MNDIKNENERLTLPFVPEAVIVGNGDFPSHPFPLAVLDQAPCVVCCDGATNALADSGRVPDLIVATVIHFRRRTGFVFTTGFIVFRTKRPTTRPRR